MIYLAVVSIIWAFSFGLIEVPWQGWILFWWQPCGWG